MYSFHAIYRIYFCLQDESLAEFKYTVMDINQSVNDDFSTTEWNKEEFIFIEQCNKYNAITATSLKSINFEQKKLVIMVNFYTKTEIEDRFEYLSGQIKNGKIGKNTIISAWFNDMKGMKIIHIQNTQIRLQI